MAHGWEQIRGVFERSLAVPPEQRAEFLRTACGADEVLRGEVEALLAHDAEADAAFLAGGAATRTAWSGTNAAASEAAPGAALVGLRVGRYTVVRVIASGGMGTVCEAVQDEPRRSVALKVVAGSLASRPALRRFRQEAELLGRLHHPNIAQVYEAGVSQEGMPFFAMEYIPGARPLTVYAREQHLDTRARLALLATVCDAVHHGHQRGIIHRDLKPANILVDAGGVPKIIDFGVARATDNDVATTTQATCAGELIGTVQYMSPEQCEGNPQALDTRSDVYSLGVVMYELLTGELPYAATGVGLLSATRTIREAQPRRPSEVNRRLRGDLETIVLKALEKDRERRYDSAAALGQDVRRYLAGAPIEARPPTVWLRTLRWAARHPLWITGLLCGLMLGSAGLSTALALWFLRDRPHAVAVPPNRDAVQLVTFSGETLRTWEAGRSGAITVAALVRSAAEGGAGGVLLGVAPGGGTRIPGGLYLYPADSEALPATWSRTVLPAEVPERIPAGRGGAEQFGVQGAFVEDIFPETPGDEIVAVFQHGMITHSAIRVYARGGELLYQVWADFQMELSEGAELPMPAMLWLPRARLLVLGGVNGTALIAERGGQQRGRRNHPYVVFALPLAPGFVTAQYVAQEENEPVDDPRLRPAWCHCVLPMEAVQNIRRIGVTRAGGPAGGGFQLSVSLEPADSDAPRPEVTWMIDAAGRSAAPLVNDHYRRARMLPPDDPGHIPEIAWRLGPLPAIQRGADASGAGSP